MTKRLTIALVALAMFVLVAIMPASASFYYINTSVNQGATVFIGEQGLKSYPRSCIYCNGATGLTPTQIGWWASAADICNKPLRQRRSH